MRSQLVISTKAIFGALDRLEEKLLKSQGTTEEQIGYNHALRDIYAELGALIASAKLVTSEDE